MTQIQYQRIREILIWSTLCITLIAMLQIIQKCTTEREAIRAGLQQEINTNTGAIYWTRKKY